MDGDESTGGSFGFPPSSILGPVRGATPVWLVGMMGAGKSTVGPALARRLGRRFLDTDQQIEGSSGKEIETIFSEDGEETFRVLEAAVIAEAARGSAVVALGGGAIAEPGAAERLAGWGTVVYLRAMPETLVSRIGDASARPLLRGLSESERLERVRKLLAKREPSYRTARITVDTDHKSASEVVEELARKISAIDSKEGEAV